MMSNIHKRLLFLLVLLVVLAGCQREGRIRKSSIIQDKKLISLLRDIHLTNAYMTVTPVGDFEYPLDSLHLYGPVFEKYRVSERKFLHTMKYYAEYPDEFELLYERVIKELSEFEASIMAEQSRAVQDPFGNLWPYKTTWTFPGDSLISNLAFDIPLMGPGVYTITIKMTVFPDDQSVNPRLTAWFWGQKTTEVDVSRGKTFLDYFGAGTANYEEIKEMFPERPYDKSGITRTYMVSKQLTNTELIYLQGRILEFDPPPGSFQQHVRIDDITINFTPAEGLPSPR